MLRAIVSPFLIGGSLGPVARRVIDTGKIDVPVGRARRGQTFGNLGAAVLTLRTQYRRGGK